MGVRGSPSLTSNEIKLFFMIQFALMLLNLHIKIAEQRAKILHNLHVTFISYGINGYEFFGCFYQVPAHFTVPVFWMTRSKIFSALRYSDSWSAPAGNNKRIL